MYDAALYYGTRTRSDTLTKLYRLDPDSNEEVQTAEINVRGRVMTIRLSLPPEWEGTDVLGMELCDEWHSCQGNC